MINEHVFIKLKSISEKQWGVIYKKLVLYADLKLKRLGFKILTEVDNISGEDFVSIAFEKLFDGTRQWDYNRFPDVEIHLKGIVKSLISNHIKLSSKRDKKVQTEIVVDFNDESTNMNTFEIADSDDEELELKDRHWNYLDNLFEDDLDAQIIFYDWLEDIPPREIAIKYKKPIKDVYNACRKGKRAIASLSKMLQNG